MRVKVSPIVFPVTEEKINMLDCKVKKLFIFSLFCCVCVCVCVCVCGNNKCLE
jgi:hypothetical protein